MNTADSIAIVIVLYNPADEDIDFIREMSLSYSGVVVDNSPIRNIKEAQVGKMHYIPLMENKGIAHAQNVAVEYAIKNLRPQYIVFLDQDSRFSEDYPKDIVEEFRRVSQETRLAFLGPSVENQETEEAYKSIFHQDKVTNYDFIPRREVISSGGCTSVECLNDVGLNDADLFIDYVDFEWCWRAASKKYVCGITPKLRISHHVGRETITIFDYIIIVSSPIRYFYQFRNYLWLVRRNYVPLQWKVATGIKNMSSLIYFPLCIKQGVKCWKYMLKGIRAGLRK